MPDPSLDEAFGQHVLKTGMATADQLREAMRFQARSSQEGATISLAQALVRQGTITARQRETVESKLEVRREQLGMLGHFQILRKLGEGGMGAVYLARDAKADRPVALKILPKAQAKNESFLKRFLREADAATQFNHVNIAQAYSLGEEKGYHFYVMEFCEGSNLKERLKSEGRFPIDETLQIMIQVARGLKYAHELGFVHRDIKPDNIIVTPQGIAKILDLGLTKNLEDAEQSFRTLSGVAIGTPHYLSPEQARGEREIDGRADVYSLGATAYHLLTGDTPFHGSSSFDIITKHLTEQLRDPQDLREEIPDGVSHVIRRMMAKNPKDRYQSCHALLPDLELVIDGKEPVSGKLDAQLSSVAAPVRRIRPGPPTRRMPLADLRPPARHRRLWIGGLAAAGGIALVTLVLLTVPSRSRSRDPEPEAARHDAPTPSVPPRARVPVPPSLETQRLPLLDPAPPPLPDESRRDAEARRTYQELRRMRERGELSEPQLQARLDRFVVEYKDTPAGREAARQLGIELTAVVNNPPPTTPPPAPEPKTETPKPTPPPSPIAPPTEAYRSGWREAMALAAGRDAAAAAAALEKVAVEEPVRAERDADLAAIRSLQAFYAGATAILAKTPKGQKVSIEYWGPAGDAAKVEDAVARIDAHRIEVRQGAATVTIPYGEVRARTLAPAWLARPGAQPDDATAAAFACVVEGDLEGLKLLGFEGVAERFAAWSSAPPAEDEAEARRIFRQAEQAWFDFARTQEAADAYKSLLADHGRTAFVRRNRAAIAARTEVPREFFYQPADMGAAGGFLQGQSKKVETCWTSEKDLDDAQRRTNFVEISFPAAAGTPYRCWFYVGGCCLEVFAFFAQGTEFTGLAEPGSEFDVPVKHSIGGLRKRHHDHIGPKEPDRWEWVAVPLPKYASAGTKRVRLLTDQKGFSVATAVVSSTRTGTPSERELATMEKLRADTPGFTSGGLPSSGSILREWWTGIGGGEVVNLTTHPDFPNKPAGFELITTFASPQNFGDNYGTRLRGYVLPPLTGDYVFWICTDDKSEVWLSTDESPARKRLIAAPTDWSVAGDWEKTPTQKSAPIRLEAGKRYYVEALHKEGAGGDHVMVGWQLPDGKQERPIPGSRLAPHPPPRR